MRFLPRSNDNPIPPQLTHPKETEKIAENKTQQKIINFFLTNIRFVSSYILKFKHFYTLNQTFCCKYHEPSV